MMHPEPKRREGASPDNWAQPSSTHRRKLQGFGKVPKGEDADAVHENEGEEHEEHGKFQSNDDADTVAKQDAQE